MAGALTLGALTVVLGLVVSFHPTGSLNVVASRGAVTHLTAHPQRVMFRLTGHCQHHVAETLWLESDGTQKGHVQVSPVA